MPGKINIYDLGVKGVNVTKSPIHLDDGEMTQAQNAVFDPEGIEGGIRKRGGLTNVNSSAAAGAIMGISSVPLPDPASKTIAIWAALGTNGAPTWLKSTDEGATWATATVPSDPLQDSKFPASTAYYMGRAAMYRNRLYFPKNTYTLGTAHPPVGMYDPDDGEVSRCVIPPNPINAPTVSNNILDMLVANRVLYLSVFDVDGAAPNHRGRVFSLDEQTGFLAQVGNRFGGGTGENDGGMPWCLAWYNGRLWAGTYGVSGASSGKIWSIRPGVPGVWALEHTTAASAGYIMSMCSYKGLLYAATTSDAGASALVLVRAAAGSWTISLTAPATGGYFSTLFVFNDNLYCVFYEPGGGTACLIKKFNGSSWSTDKDVETAYGTRHAGSVHIVKNADGTDKHFLLCFVATGAGVVNNDGYIVKCDTAGTYSQPATALNTNIRGYIASTVDVD